MLEWDLFGGVCENKRSTKGPSTKADCLLISTMRGHSFVEGLHTYDTGALEFCVYRYNNVIRSHYFNILEKFILVFL